MCTCVHVYIYASVHMCMCVYALCVCVPVFVSVSRCVCVYVYVCVHVRVCVYVYMYMCTLAHVQTISGKILRNRLTAAAFGEASRRLCSPSKKRSNVPSPLDPILFSTLLNPWKHLIYKIKYKI